MQPEDRAQRSTVCDRIFIQRDFSEGTAVRFQTSPMPFQLRGRINPTRYAEAIGQLNKLFDEAEAISPAVCFENALGCLTAYLAFLCINTHYEKILKKVTLTVEDLNQKRAVGFYLQTDHWRYGDSLLFVGLFPVGLPDMVQPSATEFQPVQLARSLRHRSPSNTIRCHLYVPQVQLAGGLSYEHRAHNRTRCQMERGVVVRSDNQPVDPNKWTCGQTVDVN
ncbi:Golgin sub A member 7 [Clonorchis sinensis]|uniref:Ras modification protein ERF4 n=2 Tax=Clonorchis sinensis TaxID=79923 RepID=A0A3R7JW60_CLOSI|nr:Golgin sub A member 7 [Clonorchis sinensis]